MSKAKRKLVYEVDYDGWIWKFPNGYMSHWSIFRKASKPPGRWLSDKDEGEWVRVKLVVVRP